MTPNGSSEFQRSVYDTCDPQYLRALREAAGMDVFVLARTACLSVAQVRQLESDSDGLFYSDAIKRQAYKRLLMILGAEPPTVEVPQELRDAAKVADAHLETLDQIVAMSQQPVLNRSSWDVMNAGFAKLKAHKQAVGALALLVAAVGLFLMQGPQGSSDAAPLASSTSASVVPETPPVVTPPVEPIPAPVASAPVVQPVAAPVVQVASAVAAPTPAVAASVAVASNTSACVYSNESMPQLSPFVAQKEGRYVYLVATAPVEICVIDGNKQATTLQIKAGENRSVYGASPWQVSSANLSKVQIYFQGGRVSLPEAATRVRLLEVPVSR